MLRNTTVRSATVVVLILGLIGACLAWGADVSSSFSGKAANENWGGIRPAAEPSPASPLTVFTNATAINPPDDGATGTTSTINVSAMAGTISSVTVTLNNYTTPRPQQVDFLLVGPGGQKLILLSDAGGTGPVSQTNNVTITFSDAGATQFTQDGPLTTGTFRPVDYDASVNFPTSAPPYQSPSPLGGATFNSVFGGLSGASVNGNWVLHVFDSSAGSGASTIAGGWSLDIVTAVAASPTTTTISSSLNPSNTNQAVTFTSTTTSSSTVNTGVVDFVDTTTGVTLCNDVSVNGSGQTTCLVPANTLSERRHNIQATYVGNATFATSNGSLTQTVNFPTSRVGNTFTNAGGINIPDAGTSPVPYPSNIIVSSLTGSISKVAVTLTNASLPATNNHNFLLVGPNGDTYVFWSDAGGNVSSSGITVTLDDTAASQLPSSGAIATGTYRPTDYNVDDDAFPAPAPVVVNRAAPQGSATFASVFGGDAPNGTWSLYPYDDAGSGNTSSIGSWSLTFTTTGDAPTTTVISGNPNPSTTSQAVTFTATVTSGGNPVTVGSVTFRNGATVLCAGVALNGSGQAACNQPAFAQGDHVITADYNGSPGAFNISSGSVTQQVNSPTVRTGLNFANNGGITIPNASAATPYPSRVIVSGLGGTIAKVTVSLNGINAPNPDHTDFLLVGPGGQTLVFMGDSGGTTAVSGVNVTIDDAAATQLPDGGPLTSGTFRPASYTGDTDVFPAPAPAGPSHAAPQGSSTLALFNGGSPNGTWSLYAVEDTGDSLNTTLSGWSLSFTLAPQSTSTTVASSQNPSTVGQAVTFTATVTTSGFTPTGTVQFFDGATPIGGPVALNGVGQAQVSTSSLTQGSHAITAQYSGGTGNGFSDSSGALSGGQTVLAPTAGPATISGRVLGRSGRGPGSILITLTDGSGNVHYARTSSFGYFRFLDVPTGSSYILAVRHKRWRYSPVLINVDSDLDGLVLTPEP